MGKNGYYRETVAEIDLDAIGHNVRAFRSWLPTTTKIMAAVKGNAYGHGAVPVAREALRHGASHLAVATLEEAIELRDAGLVAPLLVMGYVPKHGLQEGIKRNIQMTVYHPDHLHEMIEVADDIQKMAVLHLKVDTGMGRLGARAWEVPQLLKMTRQSQFIRLEGLFTHFACADETDKKVTREQAALFLDIVNRCREIGVTFPLIHCGNSATAIDLPEYGFNMVRIGISLYGLYPSDQVQRSHVHLQPAMTLKTAIMHVKRVAPGSGVSYGHTYRTKKEETIATLPIGYADGFNRLLSNRGFALIRGRRVPVVGRVCMDQTMVRLPDDLHVGLGEEVILYGRQGDKEIHVDEVARLIGTISYEVTCMVSRRVPRIYKRNGYPVEEP